MRLVRDHDFGATIGPRRKLESKRSEVEHLSWQPGCVADSLAIDAYAIGAVSVAEGNFVSIEIDLGMQSRDQRVVDYDIGAILTADRDALGNLQLPRTLVPDWNSRSFCTNSVRLA